jgi:hypothetical protein
MKWWVPLFVWVWGEKKGKRREGKREKMADGGLIYLSLSIRAASSIIAILLLIIQQQFPNNEYLNCGSAVSSNRDRINAFNSIHSSSSAIASSSSQQELFQTGPKSDSMIATSKSFQFGEQQNMPEGAEVEQVPFSGPLPTMIKVGP